MATRIARNESKIIEISQIPVRVVGSTNSTADSFQQFPGLAEITVLAFL
jgi:hypothetical protein